jgi:hypothetical protein
VHAAEVIGMDEHPALALREKRDASILVACDLVRSGEADAVVSAGHTGAAMAAAVLRIGRLPGVDRPALAVQMITDAGPFVLLDGEAGSTAENPLGRWGAIFAERVSAWRTAGGAPVDRRGREWAARASSARRSCSTIRPAVRRKRRGKDLTRHLPTSSCATPFFNVVTNRGLSTFIFDLFGRSSGAVAKPPRVPAAAAGAARIQGNSTVARR